METLLKVENLSKSYSGNTIIDSMSFELRKARFVTLLGPSGCGKTTLLRLIAGFETPDQGKIYLEGESIESKPSQERPINTVFQSYALFPHLSVFENVAFGLSIRGESPDLIRDRVKSGLEMVDLGSFANRRPHELSGGQQQRVAIARAVVNRPKILLLDESLSALDYKLRRQMQVELKNLQRSLGINFIFVTHDQEEALSMSDEILLLNKGRIEQKGSPQELYEEPKSHFVARFVGETAIFDAKVLSQEDSKLSLSLLGKTIELQDESKFQVNQTVQVMVRPEDLRVERESKDIEEDFFFEATLRNIVYKGPVVDLVLELEDSQTIQATEFYNENSDALEYKEGMKLYFSWVKGWEVLLRDEETGR